MKRGLLRILSLATVVAMTSCVFHEEVSTKISDFKSYISVTPLVQSMTRATELSFEAGDMAGLNITMESGGSKYAENHAMTYGTHRFTSALVWYDDADALSTITAYYPHVEGDSTPTSFVVAADQTVAGAYAASDLLIAQKSGITPSTSTVSMLFNHVMSRIVITMDNQSGLDVKSIEFSGVYAEAVVDIEKISVVADESKSKVSITAPLWNDGNYKAIIVPQTAELTFTVTMSDGSIFTRSKSAVTFVSGASYTALMTLLEADMEISLSGDINDWEDGGIIPSLVEFEEFLSDNYFVYDGEEYTTKTFSGAATRSGKSITWMVDNLRYVPEGYIVSNDATVDADVWYPYMMDYEQLVADDKVALSPTIDYLRVLQDDASIAKYGMLYSAEAAFGKSITETNLYDFEGAQGLCPPGWHIPTYADWMEIIGCSTITSVIDPTISKINTDAIFYNATYESAAISDLIEGFGFVLSGARMQSSFTATPLYQRTMVQGSNCTNTDLYGQLALSYYMSSTGYKPVYSTSTGELSNIQFFGAMSTFTSSKYMEGRLALSALSIKTGTPIRCVKDAE